MSFGAPLSEINKRDFVTPEMVFQMGVVPRRIDVLTSISGVTFEEAWAEREEIEIEDVRISVISRRHSIQNKKSTGRPKDEADAIWLEESRG